MKPPKTRWPWISLALTAALALSPLGREFYYDAFLSNEQLSRNIAQPIFLTGLAVMLALILCEYGVRTYLLRKR
jgi:hypothetical protein